MKINKLIYPSAIVMLSMILMTGCNKKEEEISSYDKPDNGISNISGYTSNTSTTSNDLSNELSNQTSNDITSNEQSNITSNMVSSNITSQVTSNKTSNKPVSNQVTSSVSQIKLENGSNLVVVKGYDSKGKVVWSYKTKSVYRVGSEPPEYYEGRTNVYVNDGGNLVALNRGTGKKVWIKTDHSAISTGTGEELNNKLYIVDVHGSTDYVLYVIDVKTGKTIKKLKTINELDKNNKNVYGDSSIIGTKSNNILVISSMKVVNDTTVDVKLEFNVNNYTVKEVK